MLLHFLGVQCGKGRAQPPQGFGTWVMCHHQVYNSDQIPSAPLIPSSNAASFSIVLCLLPSSALKILQIL